MKTSSNTFVLIPALSASRFFRLGALLLALLSLAWDAHADWGAWSMVKNHPGLEFRVRRDEQPNEYAGGKYHWSVEFRSRYRETIHFSFRLTEPDEFNPRLTDRVSVSPGETERSWSLLRAPRQIGVWTGEYRFGESDSGPYEQ